jgi:hypothetical protein
MNSKTHNFPLYPPGEAPTFYISSGDLPKKKSFSLRIIIIETINNNMVWIILLAGWV